MTSLKTCSFCLNKGIKGPHDHTIRDFGLKDYPIICPELININCSYCKEKGHTVNYCNILKLKKQNRTAFVPNIKSNKRHTVDSDGFVTSKNYDKPIVTEISIHTVAKVQRINVLSGMFAALEVEINMIDDNKEDTLSWVNIVTRHHKDATKDVQKKRWCDYEDDE